MGIAQALHAFVSFVFNEQQVQPKLPATNVSARDQLSKAKTVNDCLKARGLANKGELSDDRVFQRLRSIADGFDDWLNAFDQVDQNSELGKSIIEQLAAMPLSFDQWEILHGASMLDAIRTKTVKGMISCAKTFGQFRRVYNVATEQLDRDNLLRELTLRASTLEEKVQVYELAAADTPIRESISRDIMSTSRSFAEWEQVHDRAESESPLEQFAAAKMVESAPSTLSDLVGLARKSSIRNDESLRNAVMARLEGVSASFDQWKEVFESLDDGDDLEPFALSMLTERATDPKTLSEILEYTAAYDDEDLRETVLQKLRDQSAPFDIWKDIRGNERDEVNNIAAEKMISAAETIDQVRNLAAEFDGEDDLQEKLAARLKTIPATKGELEGILDDLDSTDVLFIAAVEKLIDMETTPLECIKLYQGWEFESEENEKILEKLFTLATPDECAIIALVAEEGTDLRDMAERRVSNKN